MAERICKRTRQREVRSLHPQRELRCASNQITAADQVVPGKYLVELREVFIGAVVNHAALRFRGAAY